MNSIIISLFLVTLAIGVSTPDIAAASKWNEERGHMPIAVRTIRSVDYLPFSSITGGCYARALYMGMELAVKNIPASNQYIFGKLRPRGAKWRWHVAPMVRVSKNVAYIFDPSFSNHPLTVEQWVRFAQPKDKPELLVAPVTHYRADQVKQMSQQKKPGYSWRRMISNMEKMPQFAIKDVANACSIAWMYIGKEDLTTVQKGAKRRNLADRTNYLVSRLTKMGKLPSGSRVINCREGEYEVDKELSLASLFRNTK